MRIRKLLPAAALTLGAVLLLSGCKTLSSPSASPVDTTTQGARAHYTKFKDATWLPESKIRAPMSAKEIFPSVEEIGKEGINAFYDTHRTRLTMTAKGGDSFAVREERLANAEGVLSYLKGSETLYRNGKAVTNASPVVAQKLDDGRIMFQSQGANKINIAVKPRTFDISGQQVMQLLRDANNQPADLAYYMKDQHTFPRNSRAFVNTYWLSEDEVVVPSKGSFTGAKTLETLITQYSGKTAYCPSYIHHQGSTPYGILFDKVATGATSGTFRMIAVDPQSLFCDPIKSGKTAKGTWKIKTLHGTRVMELLPEASVKSSDVGIQPINANAITIGFAQVVDPKGKATTQKRKVKDKRGRTRTVTEKVPATMVLPARLVKSNQPVVDFRLRFNDTASKALIAAVSDADKTRKADKK